jgi:uncharacterized protein YecE (DUF72 family)
MIRIGPAGWDYKDWAGMVYPALRPKGFDPLGWLAQYFNVVEVNSTFYRPALPSVARTWCQRVHAYPDFRFTAKLWQRFTHERDVAFTAEEVRLARKALDVLAQEGRLGAVLMQFPWSFRREEQTREWLADVVTVFGGLPLVLEVRHESWNVPEVYESLAERGIGFVNIDQPVFRDSIRPSSRATTGVGYVRIHGRNYKDWFRKNASREARYDYLYTADELGPWAERAKALAEHAQDVYIVTNNHPRGQAPVNVLMLASMLAGAKVKAPPQLFQRYQ